MQVALLGPVEVRDGDRLIPVSGARVRRLLVRLAVDAPRPVTLRELEDAVWFDVEVPREAGNALQSLVSRLRRALGEGATVEQTPLSSRLGYRLVGCLTDIVEFERLARSGHDALERGDVVAAEAQLCAALGLWRGEALVDAEGAPYVLGLVARLEEARVNALCDRIDADLAAGAKPELVGELEELVAAMPLRERLTGQLMTGLAQSGRSAEALAAYAALRERLADELGTEPSTPLRDLHLRLLRGESPERAHAATTAAGQTPALRASLTSFFGREDEIKRIHELLSAGRLTTIVGPGGAGKTRLAGEAARTWPSPRRWDGDWLVELAPITEQANLVQAFLGVLGVRESRMERPTDRPLSRDPLTRLVAALRDCHGLLVVDNCEHLVDPVAQLLAHLLQECPQVRVLATSREPIGIDGESLCVVPPLALPTAGATPEEAQAFPSVQLFVDRSAAVRAGFELTTANVASVVEIVRRLDGLPLALELAAARLRVLPVVEVAARLSDRFRLLTGGNRAAMPRHRTLRAVVEWSWDLLSAPERLLAERLAVFPAGASVASAEAVCAREGLSSAEIPELLDSLVDKSLLHVGDDGGLRYRMLETIREYGVERLAERGEVDQARYFHARYFADLVAEAAPGLRGPGQLTAFATIEREHDNTVAALRFLGDSGQAPDALALALDLSWYWMLRNEHSDAQTWLAFASSLPGAEGLDLQVLAEAGMTLNELASAESYDTSDEAGVVMRLASIAERLRALPHLGERFEPERALIQVGAAMMAKDDEDLGDILTGRLDSDDPWTWAAIRMFRASIAENHGDVELMRKDVSDALETFRAIGDRWGLAGTLSSLGYVLTLDGDLPGAADAYAEAARLMDELGADDDGGYLRLRLAGLHMRQGEYDEARRLVMSMTASAGRGSGWISPYATAVLASIAALEGDRPEMRRLRDEVARQLEDHVSPQAFQGHGQAIALASLAWLHAVDEEVEAARRCVEAAYPVALSTRDRPVIAMVGVAVAALAAGLGDAALAARTLGSCARLRGGDDPTEPIVRGLTERLRAELGADFERLYQSGKALSHAQAEVALDPALLPGLR